MIAGEEGRRPARGDTPSAGRSRRSCELVAAYVKTIRLDAPLPPTEIYCRAMAAFDQLVADNARKAQHEAFAFPGGDFDPDTWDDATAVIRDAQRESRARLSAWLRGALGIGR